jgi:hypothetical protein
MKEIMIETIKKDITYMLKELGNIRKTEQDKVLKNKEMENIDPKQLGYRIYTMDFRSYRKMVDALTKAYDNLNQMYKYNVLKGDGVFAEYFVSSLFIEADRLHKLMETCKKDYDLYRCMSDAYIKLTDKICKIESHRPMEIEIKSIPLSNFTYKNFKLGLLQYQQDVIKFEGENLICDWTRNSGKTFTIAKIIELNKPENVLYIDNIGSISSSLNTLCDKFAEINKSNENAGRDTSIEVKIKTSMKLEILVHDQVDYSSEVNVYTLKSLRNGEVKKDMVFDYVFFAECLPYNLGVNAKQSISFISYNDSDEWLERFYPNCKISKSDYRPLVEVGLLTHKMVDGCKEHNYKKFLNEYAILDKYNESENTIKCSECGHEYSKDKIERHFYLSNTTENGRMKICKECIRNLYNESGNNFMELLQTNDLIYIEELWEASRKLQNDPVGYYFKNIFSLRQFEGKKFRDSI